MANLSVLACFSMLVVYTAAMQFTAEDGTLRCGKNGMTVDLDAAKFNKHGRDFTFAFKDTTDAGCSVGSADANGDSLVLSADFNECGIAVSSEDGSIKYSQTLYVTYGMNPSSDLVFRQERITFEVECVKSAGAEVSLGGAGYVNITSIEEQTLTQSAESAFDIKLYRTTDGTFSSPDTSSELRLGDQMYFKLEMNTIRDDLKVTPQTCYATNAKDSSLKYYLIEDGCPNRADGTVKVTETDNLKVFEWENQAFKFFGSSDAVYVTCEVTVCETQSTAAACERCSYMQRRKRRAIVDSASSRNARVHSPVYQFV